MDKASLPDRSTSLRHFMTVVFRRLWLIVGITVLAVAVGAVQLFRSKPLYEAQSKLLLERDPELEKALLLRISGGTLQRGSQLQLYARSGDHDVTSGF